MSSPTLSQPSSAANLRGRLKDLDPSIPWCHYFELPGGVETVTAAEEPYFTKAKGLQKIGKQLLECVPFHTRNQAIEGLTVLDLASGEGGHTIEFARAGAKHVIGVEGRQLYVNRAEFVAECYGLSNAEFVVADVRNWLRGDERFDIVLCLGILHHLAPDDFEPMLRRLHRLTADTMFLYTHTSEQEGLPPKPKSILGKFKGRLSAETEIASGFRGRLYKEHPEHMSAAEKERRVRSSLDNNYSFWPRELSLIDGIKRAGFRNITRLLHPSPFGEPARDFRVLYVCRQ